ncbi:MAG: hypothetical protein F4228_03030 [Acidobacteria bacterium]|nr:hypothetical protein [Acidobacteriota bacterium]MYF13656.1 hypothetical protein [Acidobacteriota bacterium]MYI95412.1 hypothetical protein [Acidobacteriota bacterium]
MRIRASRGLLIAPAVVMAGTLLPAAFAGGVTERVERETVGRKELVGEIPVSGASAAAEPKLTLRAPRQLFLRPRMPGEMRRPSLDVEVSARLEDLDTAENLEDYYCLEEVWDWDDDTESVYEPDCDPYEEGSEIETFFFGSHRFSLPGTYRVWLRLQRSGETVIAGNVIVRIRN